MTDVAVRQRIEQVLAASSFTFVCQPIVDLGSGELLGAEALAQFAGPPQQPPDVWFKEAEQVGLGVQLQLAAAATALTLLDELPDHAFLAVNLGPDALVAPNCPCCFAQRGLIGSWSR